METFKIISLEEIENLLLEFEKKLKIYNTREFIIDDFKKVILVENSLALYIEIDVDYIYDDIKDYYLRVIELNNNNIYDNYSFIYPNFIYNFYEDGFKNNFIYEQNIMVLDCKLKENDLIEKIKNSLSEIPNLIKNNCLYDNKNIYFIVSEMDYSYGGTQYITFNTTQTPRSFMKNDYFLDTIYNSDAFNSWKRKKYEWRLEKHMRYFYFKKNINNNFLRKEKITEIIEHCSKENMFLNEIKYPYNYKSPNKWVSEQRMVDIIKKLYKKYKIEPQYRPSFLVSSNGGQMSYDCCIPELNLAFEYQGKQHFEPIDFFGGEEKFKEQVKRDKEKLKLSNDNGVKLIYINYNEDLTEDLIKRKIKDILN